MTDDRNTKSLAKRVDPLYVNRPAPLRSFRRWLVVLSVLVIAGLWGSWHLWAGSERIYNPGPVAAAHAMFESDCARCHEGSGNKFFKTVNDSACLTCHDAAIHSDKQMGKPGDPHSFVSFDATDKGGKAARSANCVACHVEHKGHDALRGVSDKLCTQCHDNVATQVAGGKPEVQNAVTAFAAGGAHPDFGRQLGRDPAGRAVDPTELAFDHKKHIAENAGLADCSRCHATQDAPHKPVPPKRGALPPYTSGEKAGGRLTEAAGARRYMEPVSYARHCAACHEMDLSGGAARGVTPPFAGVESVEHGTMASLRGDIARMVLALPRDAAGYMLVPQKEKPAADAEASVDAGDAGRDGAGDDAADHGDLDVIAGGWRRAVACPPRKPPATPAAEPKAITREQWLEENGKYLIALSVKAAEGRLEGQPVKTAGAQKNLAQVKAIAAAVKPAGTEASFAAAVELFAVYGAANACAKCHTISSPLAATATSAPSANPPTPAAPAAPSAAADPDAADPFQVLIPRKPAAPVEPETPAAPAAPAVPAPAGDPNDKRAVITSEALGLKIVPTSLPAHPRRWFPASRFDHQSHRAVNCAECHTGIPQSVETAELHMPAMQSCLRCHQSGPTAPVAVASSGCITCHDYHDHGKEREPVKQMKIQDMQDRTAKAR